MGLEKREEVVGLPGDCEKRRPGFCLKGDVSDVSKVNCRNEIILFRNRMFRSCSLCLS